MEAFLATERILLVHHSTTRQPMTLGALKFRTMKIGTPVTLNDIHQILALWPSAYTITELRGQPTIECADLPHAADRRRVVFTELWERKENLMRNSSLSPCALRSGPPPEPLIQRSSNTGTHAMGRVAKADPKRRVLRGVLKQTPGRSTDIGSLLDRIRAKEAKLRVMRNPHNLQKQTDLFLGSQIPKMKRVLTELATSKDASVCSFDLERMMDIMRENMAKLGDDELQRCLELLSQLHPSFCSIVTSGDTTFVKLNTSVLDKHDGARDLTSTAVEGPQSVAV